MNEMQAIIEAFDESQAKGDASALATVVSIEGSAYRRPGARMLVTYEEVGTRKGYAPTAVLPTFEKQNDASRRSEAHLSCGISLGFAATRRCCCREGRNDSPVNGPLGTGVYRMVVLNVRLYQVSNQWDYGKGKNEPN